MFTSLGNGLVSAMIAFVRTLVLEVGAVLVLPMLIGPDGIWLSVIVAEGASLILTTAIVAWLGPAYGIVRPSKGARRREERRKRRRQDCDA